MDGGQASGAGMTWLLFALMTVATWGVYGVLLHTGQVSHDHTRIALVANRVRENTRIFHELEDFLARTGVTGDIPPDADAAVRHLAEFVAASVEKAGLATRLSHCGVPQDHLPTLAEQAAKQWTGTFNPRKVSPDEWLDLYNQAY